MAPADALANIQYSHPVLLGGRIISPWIQIIGKNARAAPIIHLEFTHQGDIITSVNAEVRFHFRPFASLKY